ncbi:MAG: TlpA family protein disulfide reductase [Flavipsychrobacter sp.]
MKTPTFSIKGILLGSICLFTVADLQAQKIVKLHGHITNPLSDSINVQFYISDVGFEVKNYNTRLEKTGNFSLQFPVADEHTILHVVHGEQQTDLVAEPGFDLDITLDARNFDSSLHYTGESSAIGNFCALHELNYGLILDFERETQQLCGKDPAAFEKSLDSMYQLQIAFLEEHKKGLDAGFIKFWKANYRYSTYSLMLIYPYIHEMHKQQSMRISNVPETNFTVVKDVPEVFDDQLLELAAYQVYVERLYDGKFEAAGIKEGRKDSLLKLAFRHNNMPPKTAEFFAANLINRGFKYNSLAESKQAMDGFKQSFPHSKYTAMLNEKLAIKKKLNPGQPELDFAIHTIDGKDIKLSDLKGKVVMLDFWASWCMPCMAEMPYAAKIEQEYKDKDVVFLYVSVDEDENAWKNAIEKHKIEGMHMRATGGMEGPLAKQYDVEGIPSYFLIDKSGKYAMVNSLRPSDGDKLKTAIDSLLK